MKKINTCMFVFSLSNNKETSFVLFYSRFDVVCILEKLLVTDCELEEVKWKN
jgi:hypothetical protein